MRAWKVRELGEPQDMPTLAEMSDPEPGPGQLLVRVPGAATDLLAYPLDANPVLAISPQTGRGKIEGEDGITAMLELRTSGPAEARTEAAR